ncbi:MAG: Crp/Fnr family transcriptional regulator [Candidatus Dormiibacterota bacterium]
MIENVQDSRRAIWEEVLEGVVEPAHVPAGDLIFRSGSPPRIALIRAGIVRVYLSGTKGHQLTIRYGRRGDLVGLAPLLGGSRTWSAEAVVDSTVELLTMDHIHAAAGRRPELPWLIAEHVATWLSSGLHALQESCSLPTAARIARHLGEMALPSHDGLAVAHITHQRLADAVGTAREVVSRELSALRANGIIATKPQRVEILDAQRLKQIATGRVPGRERGPHPPHTVATGTEPHADATRPDTD